MAKFARLTYGLKGDTKEYIYVVNDNVRAGDVLQPSVKHYISGRIYGTTGIAQKVNKNLSGEEWSKISNTKDGFPREIGTGKDFGITGDKRSGTGKISKDEESGKYRSENADNFNPNNSYVQQTRQQNVELARREQVESEFDRYSAPYMNNKGER